MIIWDLEWNRGYDNKAVDEILQIGAVKVARPGAPVLDTFSVFIRPVIHKKFDLGARSLPDLDRSKRSKTDFPAALSRFLAWCGDDRVFASWGPGEFSTLFRNCEYFHLPSPKPAQTYDIQAAFSRYLEDSQQCALWRAVEYLNIPDCFVFHNALNDAMYTALVAQYLPPETVIPQLSILPVPTRLLRFSQEPYPPQPRYRVGPLPTLEAVLDARAGRRAHCPHCGAAAWVQQWYEGDGGQYFSPFHCPQHGRFLCRLTTASLPDGTWRGRSTVPVMTPPIAAAYAKAALGKQVHLCKASRKRRRRKKRQSA